MYSIITPAKFSSITKYRILMQGFANTGPLGYVRQESHSGLPDTDLFDTEDDCNDVIDDLMYRTYRTEGALRGWNCPWGQGTRRKSYTLEQGWKQEEIDRTKEQQRARMWPVSTLGSDIYEEVVKMVDYSLASKGGIDGMTDYTKARKERYSLHVTYRRKFRQFFSIVPVVVVP